MAQRHAAALRHLDGNNKDSKAVNGVGMCQSTTGRVCLRNGTDWHVFGHLPDVAEIGWELGGRKHGSARTAFIPYCNDYGVAWIKVDQELQNDTLFGQKFEYDWKNAKPGWALPVTSLYNPGHAFHW